MESIIENIRKEAKRILEEKLVDVVIGFEKGTTPYTATPIFIDNPKDVEKLTWDRFCYNNLAVYLKRFSEKKIGIIVKGCDSRSIVALLVENQIKRENLYMIGIPCNGMFDRKIILEKFGKDFSEKDSEVNDLLHYSCKSCSYKNPVECDVLIGNRVEENKDTKYKDISEFENKSIEERWKSFVDEASKCIRCYACRQACPMCYCNVCFVDITSPKWIEPGYNVTDLQSYHLIRAFHLAGRCVDCGSCEIACPMDINILWLTRKLNKDILELYNFETGLDKEKVPPLGTFSFDDKEEFIL